MSGGGAGKVYFVLYLAVILELLIIIVERDEAEEHLVKKRKESMKIVESILAQLQTGSGTEGINTRPQDEITVVTEQQADGPKIRQDREYVIEVGVTDVRAMENKAILDANDSLAMMKLSNVGDLEYQIFFATSKEEQPPLWPNEDSLVKMRKDISNMDVGEKLEGYPEWEMKAIRRLTLNDEQTLLRDWRDPYYGKFTVEKGPTYGPDGLKDLDSIFFYDSLGTAMMAERNGGKFDRRRFVVRFQPDKNAQDGWYKLRFFSRTNKILGVQGAETRDPKPDEVVNIGTVKLKVKDLHEVLKEQEKELKGIPPRELARDPETRREFNDRIAELKDKARAEGDQTMIDKYQLYSYIVKLITPGASDEFEQNKGSIEIDVRVVKPPMKEEVPLISNLPDRVNVFDKLSRLEIPFQVSPATGSTDLEGTANGASIKDGTGGIVATASGGARLTEKVLSVPISGNLFPRPEPYIFTVSQRAGAKAAEPVKCSVFVFETKVDNAEDISSFMELYWGSFVEFTAIVPTVFKSNEFVVTVNPGDNQQRNPFRKLTIKEADGLRVPAGASSVTTKIEWEDKFSKERVTLFEGQGEASLKPPIILTKDAFAQPITNLNDPVFDVEGITILAPTIGEGERAQISTQSIRITIQAPQFDPNSIYKNCGLELVGQPRLSGNKLSFRLRLKNPPPGMRKGTLRAFADIQVMASAMANGTNSAPRLSKFNVVINN